MVQSYLIKKYANSSDRVARIGMLNAVLRESKELSLYSVYYSSDFFKLNE